MLNAVHHVHYVVHDLDAMVDYLKNNFGMTPDKLETHESVGMKDALYKVGETLIEISEPLTTDSNIGRHLAQHGPGVYHVAWGVDNIRDVARALAAKGNKLRGEDGITHSPRGYLTINISQEDTHGLWLQLAEG